MCKFNQRLFFLIFPYLVFAYTGAGGQSLGQDPVANTPVVANNDFGRTYKMATVEINVSRNDYGIGVGISGIEITTPQATVGPGSTTITPLFMSPIHSILVLMNCAIKFAILQAFVAAQRFLLWWTSTTMPLWRTTTIWRPLS